MNNEDSIPKNKRLVIAIDCDDVLVSTADSLFRHYNQTKNHDISDYTELWQALSTEEAKTARDSYLDTQEYLAQPPIENAKKVLTKLKENHTLHIVTGRPDFMADITEAWIERHLPGLFTSINFTNNFKPTGDKSVQSKAALCHSIGADLLIDDHTHHAIAAAEAQIPVILFGDYPWNKSFPANPLIQKAKNWNDVSELLS